MSQYYVDTKNELRINKELINRDIILNIFDNLFKNLIRTFLYFLFAMFAKNITIESLQ